MTAREFLNNARILQLRILSATETLESLREPSAVVGKERGGKCSVRENKETDKQLRRLDLEEKLSQYIEDLLQCKDAIFRLTTESPISNLSKTLIEQRYVLCRSWKEVAAFMEYSLSYVKRVLDKEAIAEAENCKESWLIT